MNVMLIVKLVPVERQLFEFEIQTIDIQEVKRESLYTLTRTYIQTQIYQNINWRNKKKSVAFLSKCTCI